MTIIQPLRNFSGVRAGEIFFKYSSDYCSLFGNNLEFIINSCESKRSLIGNRSVRCQATSRQGQRPTKRCPFAFLSAIPSYSWLLHRAIEERHDLGSRAVVAGAEQTIADTTGNAVLLRPSNRRRIVGVRGHVQEGGITAHGRAAVGAPQEGDRLRSRAVAVGVEGHSAGAAGEALLNRP